MRPISSITATPPSEPPGDTLQALHQSGRLAGAYPRVPELLRGLDEERLQRAGRILARLSPDEVLAAHPDTPQMSVTVTGHSTVSGLVPPLTAELARHGLLLRPHVTDFDGWVFELSDPTSELYATGSDLVVCLLDASVVFEELPLPWGPPDVEAALEEKVRLVGRLAATHAASGGALVCTTMPLPRSESAQLVDLSARARLGAVWRQANARLLGLMEEHPGLVVLDADVLLTDDVPLRDARLATYAKTHFSPGFTARCAREVAHLARGRSGRAKKVLVLDLDDTLWGGVLGDDGASGIEVAGSLRGEAFRAFQRTIRQLASRGVLVAAVSKNDPEPVRRVLEDHPEMTLRADDFVRVVANWAPKHENLRNLAADLNVGLDSFVFADDSSYECGLVTRELPEVTVLHLDGDPATHLERALADDWFAVRDLTDDDIQRPARYREDLERRDFLDNFSSLDGYLRDLRIQVGFGEADEREVVRVAQLTQRSNQFNLTTHRMQQDEVRLLAGRPGFLVLAIRSRDRFGDNGVVGAVFVDTDGPEWKIENFVLSCRAFSRGIEQACLSALLQRARAAGADAVSGRYVPSAKNGKVRDFLPRNGFDTTAEKGGGTLLFRHALQGVDDPPAHVDLTATMPEEETRS